MAARCGVEDQREDAQVGTVHLKHEGEEKDAPEMNPQEMHQEELICGHRLEIFF